MGTFTLPAKLFPTVALCLATGFFGSGSPAYSSEIPAAVDDDNVEGTRPRPDIREGAFRLSAAREISLGYALDAAPVQPIALASGDFDEDGVADLISGYTSLDTNVLTLHRGNVDSIYPHSPEARQRRLEGRFSDEPFLPSVRVFQVPVRPDFVAAGDFDNDGHWDVVLASSGEASLYLLPGDGNGGLQPAEHLKLAGTVTALVAGEINRADGLVDLVVGVRGPDGPALLVFEGPEGALRSAVEVLPVSAAPTELLLGRFVEGPWHDLAVAAGEELFLVRGRDRRLVLDEPQRAEVPPPVVERIVMPSAIESLAWGDFAWEPVATRELALLLEDGTIRLLGLAQTENEGVGLSWETIGERVVLAPRTRAEPSFVRQLLPVRVSGSPTEDLAILDAIDGRLDVLAGMVREDTAAYLAHPGIVVSVELQEPSIAALGMRLNRDALTDLVLLRQGVGGPLVVETELLATITVNTAADSTATDGTCTLREALNNSNSDTDTTGGDCVSGAGVDTIDFNIGGGGSTATIAPTSALPPITDPVTIDGTTQGCASPPCVVLDGSGAGFVAAGLHIAAGSSNIRGLVVHQFLADPGDPNFAGHGILITSSGSIVEGNYCGTDVTGTVALGNGGAGIRIDQAGSNNTIGGTIAAARNVSSGNGGNGIFIFTLSNGNQILGNYLGTDVTGTLDLGNNFAGVQIENSSGNTVGGTTAGARNILSGSNSNGVTLDPDGNGNLVLGNYIGTDVTGTAALGNTFRGVSVRNADNNTIGGTAPGARNVISGNGTNGIFIRENSSGDQVLGNYIGTDFTGTVDLGNTSFGVWIQNSSSNAIGGTSVGARNIISGNEGEGVFISGAASQGNFVLGNFIGTDATGTVDLGNAPHGVNISFGSNNTIGGTSAGARNIISGNGFTGVAIFGSTAQNNVVRGNFIGTDVTGTVDLGNSNNGVAVEGSSNTIGGTSAGARNIISGNGFEGVVIFGSTAQDNVVLGNYIGTDVTGTIDLGNSGNGVAVETSNNTIGGTTSGARNIISGNDSSGVLLFNDVTGVSVLGNYIGTQVDGTSPLGNMLHGVQTSDGASNNTIGGTGVTPGKCDGPCNRIGFSQTPDFDGVRIQVGSGNGNAILGNSIFASAALGIDLGPGGVTLNDVDPGDPDTGANNLQNFPMLSLAEATPSGATVDGSLNSTPNRPFRIEFFANLACDSSGYGEGSRYLGFTNVVTDGTGDTSFSAALTGPVSDGEAITATASSTGLSTNTSEFSECFTATCLSTAVFGQTVLAQNKSSLNWAAPDHVRFVKGDLVDVSSYLITETGELPAATSLDISSDNPGSGDGLYYLIRSTACGSWQTTPGAEPGRSVLP